FTSEDLVSINQQKNLCSQPYIFKVPICPQISTVLQILSMSLLYPNENTVKRKRYPTLALFPYCFSRWLSMCRIRNFSGKKTISEFLDDKVQQHRIFHCGAQSTIIL
ncbi:hypothetical protein CFOL_v3_27191, partial [Cephalotus follicularis]